MSDGEDCGSLASVRRGARADMRRVRSRMLGDYLVVVRKRCQSMEWLSK